MLSHVDFMHFKAQGKGYHEPKHTFKDCGVFKHIFRLFLQINLV
jgi:hypothetical protein